jgi:tetratricopeptide (TPR) repeat protein
MLITSSRDGDSLEQKYLPVPPLFAGPLRDDLITRVGSAISSGDHNDATLLLQEANHAFPGDRVFELLHLQYLKVAQRKAHFEAALQEAVDALTEDRFVASLGKFREALLLSQGHVVFQRKIYDVSFLAANQQAANHWRFAEALLHEVTSRVGEPAVPSECWDAIEKQKCTENIRVALDESGRAEHIEYLPHLRGRLAELARRHPEQEEVASRLSVLDQLLAQRFADEREKNLRRLTLFRDRLDLSNNPLTLKQFDHLVSPFVGPYSGDSAFLAILYEVRELQVSYETAAELLVENRLPEVLQTCDQVLQRRPKNLLFAALEEKAKAREWVERLVTSATQRARAFEQRAQYAEALEEWESLREIDPQHPGLDSEILHCAALKQQAESVLSLAPPPIDEAALTPEIVEEEPVYELPVPAFVTRPAARGFPSRVRIVIAADAWNNLKTGLAATMTVLLVVLMFASKLRR